MKIQKFVNQFRFRRRALWPGDIIGAKGISEEAKLFLHLKGVHLQCHDGPDGEPDVGLAVPDDTLFLILDENEEDDAVHYTTLVYQPQDDLILLVIRVNAEGIIDEVYEPHFEGPPHPYELAALGVLYIYGLL